VPPAHLRGFHKVRSLRLRRTIRRIGRHVHLPRMASSLRRGDAQGQSPRSVAAAPCEEAGSTEASLLARWRITARGYRVLSCSAVVGARSCRVTGLRWRSQPDADVGTRYRVVGQSRPTGPTVRPVIASVHERYAGFCQRRQQRTQRRIPGVVGQGVETSPRAVLVAELDSRVAPAVGLVNPHVDMCRMDSIRAVEVWDEALYATMASAAPSASVPASIKRWQRYARVTRSSFRSSTGLLDRFLMLETSVTPSPSGACHSRSVVRYATPTIRWGSCSSTSWPRSPSSRWT
jgi:hypothetical protein